MSAKPRGYWNKQTCYNAAQECKTRAEFKKKFGGANWAAYKNGWIDDYTWFVGGKKTNGYWKIYENCCEASKSCKSRKEFSEKYDAAYRHSLENDWIDDFVWLKSAGSPYSTNRDNVYAYFFKEQKAVYIGRTIQIKVRDSQHNKRGVVRNFALMNNTNVPSMEILKENLSLEDGQFYEDYFVKKIQRRWLVCFEQSKNGSWYRFFGCYFLW